MSKSIFVIGGSKGLGRNLVEELGSFSKRIAVSRSVPEGEINFQHIKCEAKNFKDKLTTIDKKSISLFIYAASAWGETTKLELQEYESFMQSGPEGLISSFNALKDNFLLADDALIVSIGSTASEKALSLTSELNDPVYSIAKLTQKALLVRLAMANKSFRFSTLTIGSIGEGNKSISFRTIRELIESLYAMTPDVGYSEITLVPKELCINV